MKTSYRKSDFLRGFNPLDKLGAGKFTTRRGVSGIAVIIIVAGIFIVSVGFLSFKFNRGGLLNSPNNFFERTSALISKTFGDMFSSGQDKPAVEIDLGEQAANVNGGENKNPAIATNESLDIQLSGEKKSTEKISENKNPDSSAEHPIAQSSTSENNFSVNSSSDSELPMVNNPKTSASPSPALCDFTKVQIPNHKILFSEIAWMGSGKSVSDEWIELKNNSGGDVSLAGWQILSDDENLKIIFEEKNNFSAGSLYLLERTDNNSTPNVSADKIYSGALSNDGVRLGIFNANCELADEIDASKTWPAGDNTAKKTMERSSVDLSWHTSVNAGGTPKAQNSAAFAVAQPPAQPTQSESPSPSPTSSPFAPGSLNHIVISETQITGGPGQTTNDFVEIYNPLAEPFNLKGHRLVKRTKAGTSDTSLKSWIVDATIPPGGSYLWANSGYTTIAMPPNATTTGSIADDNGIAIRFGAEDTGTIIDAVAWGGATNAFVEGSAFPTNPGANQILKRKFINAEMQDMDNNAEDFEIR